MTTQPPTDAAREVTQEDRELFSYLLGWDASDDQQRILDGAFDHWPKMQRIARHRLSTRQQPEAGRGTHRDDPCVRCHTPHDQVPVGRCLAATDDDLIRRGDAFAVAQMALEGDPEDMRNALHVGIADIPALSDTTEPC